MLFKQIKMKRNLLTTKGMLFIIVSFAFLITSGCKRYEVQKEPAKEKTKEIAEWEKLKYGMFIHFSMNNFAGNEYDNGSTPAIKYDPTNLDVKQWIHTAKLARMSYAVLTAKHQSGFCLWDSKVTWKGKEYDYDVAASSNKTDVVAEFVKACNEEGIKPGLYYCIFDPRNEGKVDWTGIVADEYYRLIKGQIEELQTNYKGIAEQWIDIPAKLTKAQLFELYGIIKRNNPGCMVMSNNGFKDGVRIKNWPTDLINGERTLPPATGHNPFKTVDSVTYYIPMEVCQTLCEFWFSMPDDKPKSLNTLYFWYDECSKRGANLLLDVPPDNSGRIPQELVARLVELRAVIDNPSLLPVPKSLSYWKPVRASSTWRNRPEYATLNAVDEDSTTRWTASPGLDSPWLEVDLQESLSFNRSIITERYSQYIKEFKLQYKDANDWKTILTVKDFKARSDRQFKTVTARYVRILITDYKDYSSSKNITVAPEKPVVEEGPSISGFQLFNQ
jgi:alpha-L-fucosidase